MYNIFLFLDDYTICTDDFLKSQLKLSKQKMSHDT